MNEAVFNFWLLVGLLALTGHNIYGQAALRGFLVAITHVYAGLPHGLNAAIQRHDVRPVTAQRRLS